MVDLESDGNALRHCSVVPPGAHEAPRCAGVFARRLVAAARACIGPRCCGAAACRHGTPKRAALRTYRPNSHRLLFRDYLEVVPDALSLRRQLAEPHERVPFKLQLLLQSLE